MKLKIKFTTCFFCLLIFGIILNSDSNFGETPKTASSGGTPKEQIFISELPLDMPLGEPGSWIELYNASKRTQSLKGIILAYNGKVLLEIKEDIKLSSQRVIEINFQDIGQKTRLQRIRPSWKSSFVIYVKPIQPTSKQEKGPYGLKIRKSGSCSLFMGKLQKECLLDYVRWGKFKKNSNDIFLKWAIESRIWKSKDSITDIGIQAKDDFPGGISFLVLKSCVIARGIFSRDFYGSDSWMVCTQAEATPSEYNQFLPPYLFHVNLTRSEDEKQPRHIEFSLRLRFSKEIAKLLLGSDTKIKYFVQMATDPYFVNVAKEQYISAKKNRIRIEDVEPKNYFIRIRIDTPSMRTNWSNTISYPLKGSFRRKDPVGQVGKS